MFWIGLFTCRQECLQAGALAALDSTKDDFRAKLQELTTKHKATVAFDAVAGQLTGDVLSAMPNGSKIYVYGGLSEDRPVISTRDLIFKKKWFLPPQQIQNLNVFIYIVIDLLKDFGWKIMLLRNTLLVYCNGAWQVCEPNNFEYVLI